MTFKNKKAVKSHLIFLTCSLFFLVNFLSGAKAQEVSGQVIDGQTNGSLPGVNVTVKGTNTGTSTDSEGNYSLSVSSLRDTLIFSFIGYKTQEIPLEGRTELNISLQPETISGEEVVVIGYGEVEKRDLTGSVSSVTSDEFNSGVQSSVDEALQGQTAGVNITNNSSEPGGGVSIRIRGSSSLTAGNDPLYVIDGQPINNVTTTPGSSIIGSPSRNPLRSLNPSDIKSVEVLKDASATAIYGSRGANGVVLITTKKGQEGNVEVTYNGSYSTQSVAKKLDLLNATEYMTFLNGLRTDQGQQPMFTEQQIDQAGSGTDWQDQILRKAPSQNHQLSFSGGSEKIQYYASLNYFNQEGIIMDSGNKRYSGRVNLNYDTDNFNFGFRLNTSLTRDDYVPNGTAINIGAGIVTAARQIDPLMSVRDENSNYVQNQRIDLNNPVAIGNTMHDDAETNRTVGNLFAEYTFDNNLSAKVQFGSDRALSRRDSYIESVTKRGQQYNGRATVNTNERSNYVLEATLNYSDIFHEDHSIDALAGYTYQVFHGRGAFSQTQDFPTASFLSNNLSAGNETQNNVNSNKYKHQLLSYLGRVNYSYLDKYLLTASFRIDGSSRFGADNKYGYFPSVALSWRLSDEPFLENQNLISNLKLRGSFGVTGNQEIGNYNSLVLLGTTGDAVFNGDRQVSIAPLQLSNPDLKWETTQQYNIGLDYGLWDNRITGSVDYFIKKTSDLLLQLPIPRTTGFNTSLQNVGSTKNSGFEFAIDTDNFRGDFGWTTKLNVSTLHNEVTGLGGLPFILQGNLRFQNDFTILREGDPINAYYGYEVDGIFQSQQKINNSAQPNASPGDLKYQDINNDGQISPDDRTILGNPFPDVTFGLKNNFSYRGFGLDIFISGKLGHEMMSFNRLDSENPISFPRNRQAYVLNRWTSENKTNENPSFINMDASKAINSRIVEDASFVRLQNLKLSYSFPKLAIGGINSFSLYATGQNLITVTDYSGYNPDVSSFGDSNIRIDYSNYPLARIYTLGINIKI